MRKPQRYTACGDEVVMADADGPLVKWEDYKRLDALCKQLMAQHSDMSCENIRLRKAGDAVALDYAERIEIEAGETVKTLMKTLPVLREWIAAKEGKPTK